MRKSSSEEFEPKAADEIYHCEVEEYKPDLSAPFPLIISLECIARRRLPDVFQHIYIYTWTDKHVI